MINLDNVLVSHSINKPRLTNSSTGLAWKRRGSAIIILNLKSNKTGLLQLRTSQINTVKNNMAGVPTAKGCDACRKQKKKVTLYVRLKSPLTDDISAIKQNQHVHAVQGSEYHVQESV